MSPQSIRILLHVNVGDRCQSIATIASEHAAAHVDGKNDEATGSRQDDQVVDQIPLEHEVLDSIRTTFTFQVIVRDADDTEDAIDQLPHAVTAADNRVARS